MAALGKNFLLAPCSNGNIAMMADIARHNNIRFDAILGAEIARTYKPAPKVYTMSCEAFGLKTSECMMVGAAGHTSDFEGAAMTGMKTGAVARSRLFGVERLDRPARCYPHVFTSPQEAAGAFPVT